MKLKSILEDTKILKTIRSPKEREKNYIIAIQKEIQSYIEDECWGPLRLEKTPIKKLPDNLKLVRGHLDLEKSKVEKLPDNLTVDGSLWMMDTPIRILPKKLTVNGNIILNNSNIEELPPDLVAEGNLYLYNTPISKKYSRGDIQKMVPELRGYVFI